MAAPLCVCVCANSTKRNKQRLCALYRIYYTQCVHRTIEEKNRIHCQISSSVQDTLRVQSTYRQTLDVLLFSKFPFSPFNEWTLIGIRF